MAGGIAATSIGGQGAIGAPSGGGTQIIGGKLYQMYSPEWYSAQRQNESDVAGAAGKAAGTYTNSYMNTAFPSLAGLTGTGAAGSGGGLSAFGMGGSATGSTGTGAAGPVSPGGGVAPLSMPDMSASNSAIFAQAKDKVGQLSRSSLDSLAGELGSQGMLGSGAQVQGTRDILSSGMGELGQVDRDLATQNANTALDVAKTNYGGALTQRGQDIQSQEANARLALEQRAQQYSLLNMILGSLRGTSSAAGVSPSSGLLY